MCCRVNTCACLILPRSTSVIFKQPRLSGDTFFSRFLVRFRNQWYCAHNRSIERAESLKLPRMFCLFGWRSVYATHWIFPFAINLPIGFILCARIVLLPFWGRHTYDFFLPLDTAEKPLFPGNFEPFIAAVLIDLYSLSEWLYFEGKSHFCLPQLWTESAFPL